jgi:hypothetical protein
MLSSSVPPKFPITFASAAPPGTGIRAIPTTPGPVPGAAALTTGFPPLTFIQPSVGGIPPDGRDFNGIFNQLSAWAQWIQAGGPVTYDSGFASAIGGYPRGTLLSSTSGHVWYENLVDGNGADPNAGFANWRVAFSPWSAQAWVATGSANAQIITLSPTPTTLAQLTGIPIHFVSQGTSTGPVTFNVNALGPSQLLQSNGAPLGAGALVSGGSYNMRFNGVAFFLTSLTSVFTDSAAGTVAISGINNASGANLGLFGNGGTTPNKYIRANNGVLEIINSTYTTTIASLTDAGVFSILGTINGANGIFGGSVSANSLAANTITSNNTIIAGAGISAANLAISSAINAGTTITAGTGIISTNGNIVAGTGRVRAGLGAFGSGDNNAATVLGDFTGAFSNPGYIRFPNGVIMQWGTQVLNGNGNVLTSFPFAFPTACWVVVCSEGAAGTPTWGSNAPSLHASGGATNSQWAHWGLQWNGSSWALSNLTTSWYAVGI